MPGKRGPDKAPRKERPSKRGVILDSALKVFSYYGYDGASLDKIALEAGVTKSLVIKFFDTKENLAAQCIRRFVDEFAGKFKAIDKRKLTYPQLVEKSAKLFKKYKKELRFLVSLVATPNNERLMQDIWGDYLSELIKIFYAFTEEVPEEDIEDTVFCIAALHFTYVMSDNEKRYDNARALLVRKLMPPKEAAQG